MPGIKSGEKIKRFYKAVSVVEQDQGWIIRLDKRTITTPERNLFEVPTQLFALAVAAEWEI
jgi:chaperone required for assembly of F1-ATPase